MLSDFTEKLSKNEKDLLDFINHSKSLATKVKDIWFAILDKLNIAHKEDARSLWEKCYKEASREASSRAKKGESSTSGEVKYSYGIHQKDIDDYVDDAYEKKNKKDYIKYAEPSQRLMDDLSAEVSLEGYSHALRDNDIRHIRNSHGERTNEKYPVSKDDIKKIPYIVQNYDKVFYKTNSKGVGGIVYVKVMPDNVVYYVESITEEYHNEKLLVNKQMVKTGLNEIPNLYGFIDAINKKQSNAQYLADLRKIRKAYVQDVKEHHSINNNVSQDEPVVNSHSMQNGEKNSQNGRSRISSAAEATRKNRESDSEYARTHAEELAKENARLRKTIEDMHMQLSQNDGSGVNMDVVRDVAKSIKENYYSKANARGLQRELAGLYTYMQGKEVDGEEVNRRARTIAEKVIESAVIKNDGLYNDYGALLDEIKNTRIRVSEVDKPGFKDGFEYYRKHYTMGKLRLSNDGTPLDVFWDSLCEEYPALFDEDMLGAEERLNRLLKSSKTAM